MSVAMLDDVDEAVDQVGAFGLIADLAKMRHRLGGVEQVDALPCREIDEVAGRQVALAVLGRRQIAELRHHMGDAEQPVEVGAADMDAAAGQDVVLAVRRAGALRRNADDREVDVPPPMSTISASSSRVTLCS